MRFLDDQRTHQYDFMWQRHFNYSERQHSKEFEDSDNWCYHQPPWSSAAEKMAVKKEWVDRYLELSKELSEEYDRNIREARLAGLERGLPDYREQLNFEQQYTAH